jgi:hypothetical protein
MWGSLATVLAALIGAGLGSLGAVWPEARLRRESEKEGRREAFQKRYFFQLQDAAESLWVPTREPRQARRAVRDGR